MPKNFYPKQQASSVLTSDEIKEFQDITWQTKHIHLSYDEALDQFSRLIKLFQSLQKFEPIPLSYKDIIDRSSDKY